MRVLHVIPSVSPVRGGPSEAVLAMVRALRVQGVDAEIATTNDDGDRELAVPLDELTTHAGVPVRFFARFSPPLRPVREFAYSRPLSRWLATAVVDYDLLHVHAVFSFASTCAMRLARQRRVPYLNRPLGQLCVWSLRQRALKKRVYLALAERANLRDAAALHFTTEQEQIEAEVLGLGTRGFVAPHGIEVPARLPDARARLRERLGAPAETKIVLFLSRLHPKKGLEVLIPALARVTDPQLIFVLAGSAESPAFDAQVERWLAESGLAARTRRVGFASGEWKQTLLQGADLFALTSHSENFGIAVVEAMAAGLPVVVTPGVALADEVARFGAGLVPALDIDAVAAALVELLADAGRREPMGRSGQRLVHERFSWPVAASRIVEQYRMILEQGGRPPAPAGIVHA